MDHDLVMEVHDGPERHQLRSVPSVDSAMIATPTRSTEHLPEPEVVEDSKQDSMQSTEAKSPTRARTRLERLTEKHTPQRPNWAMADEKAPLSDETAKTRRHLRRVPNMALGTTLVGSSFPTSGQIKALQSRASIQKQTQQSASSHTATTPNWALAEDTMPPNLMPQLSKGDEKPRNVFSQIAQASTGPDHIHPSRAGQISDTYQPIAVKGRVERGPIDSGWGQKQRPGASIQTFVATQPRPMHPEPSPGRRPLMGAGYHAGEDSTQWSTQKPGDLRRVASSPSKHYQDVTSSNSRHLQAWKYYKNSESSYGTETNNNPALSIMRLNQSGFDVASVSTHEVNAIFGTETPESCDMNADIVGGAWQGDHPAGYHTPQNSIRSMHSAPELLQKPPLNSNLVHPSAFLQVRRPRPTQGTEYLGVFPGQPTNSHLCLNEGQRGGLGGVIATHTQVLRRAPQLAGVTSNPIPRTEMQHRLVHDRMPGVEPKRITVDQAFLVEAFALQLQMQEAEEAYIPTSLPEFRDDDADSGQERHFPPHHTDNF